MAPATKRRKLDAHQVDAITFDPSARQEYLTGFHKRKEARKQNARDTAAKLAKEEKVQQRKQVCSGHLHIHWSCVLSGVGRWE